MDKDKLEAAASKLREYYNTLNDVLYYHYSPAGLQSKLDEIQDSIDYLESLLPE